MAVETGEFDVRAQRIPDLRGPIIRGCDDHVVVHPWPGQDGGTPNLASVALEPSQRRVERTQSHGGLPWAIKVKAGDAAGQVLVSLDGADHLQNGRIEAYIVFQEGH